MSQSEILYAFFTVADAKLEAFLGQVITKLGGKKFGSGGNVIAVFSQAHRACHGAMYFMKKCMDSDIQQTKIVVLGGLQTNLVEDAKFLYKHALHQQCTITDEVLKNLNDTETTTEMLGDIQLPSSTTASHLHQLLVFKGISLEVAVEELFDYSNVIEVAAMKPPVAHHPEHAPQIQQGIGGPLEVSDVNQIYDYQQVEENEQITPKEENSTTDLDSSTDPLPYTPHDQPSDKPTIATPPSSNNLTKQDLSFDMPAPGIKGVIQDKNLVTTLLLGSFSLLCIGYFAVNGNFSFFSASSEATDKTQHNEAEEHVEKATADVDSNQIATSKQPTKRVFTPILTEDESVSNTSEITHTMFPQEPGPNTAYLSIKSAPPGATVFINGAQLKGVTPLNTFLVYANKRLDIKIQKAGYDPVTKSETLLPGKRRGFMFELLPNH